MGADIHMYVEYCRLRDPGEAGAEEREYWSPFGGRINPGRNYWLFASLADVRDEGAMYEPRGLPDNLGYCARDDSRLYISESPGDRYVTPERAKSWVEKGYAKYVNDHNGNPTWVTHPDWHSHSWLTPDELQAVYTRYAYTHGQPVSVQYRALLAAMRTLENDGENKVRVVFWFDN